MAHINVNIIAPDGQKYKAPIDESVEGNVLLDSLIREISLPIKNGDGSSIAYGISLLNDLRIKEGATIKITREDRNDSPQTAFSHKPKWSFLNRSDVSADSHMKKVFVVHGHDVESKETVARQLDKLGLTPVILHEQPNKGRTIIEKFEDYADVGFTVVLLTADDVGAGKGSRRNLSKRARQNVIFELGFFIGALGRDRVCALHKDVDDIPSDFSGVLWIKMDTEGAWRLQLAREMKACGLDIDLNMLS